MRTSNIDIHKELEKAIEKLLHIRYTRNDDQMVLLFNQLIKLRDNVWSNVYHDISEEVKTKHNN